jgi:hypothetical protein
VYHAVAAVLSFLLIMQYIVGNAANRKKKRSKQTTMSRSLGSKRATRLCAE